MASNRNQGINTNSDKSEQNFSNSKSRLLSVGGQRHKTELMQLLASFEEDSPSSSKKIVAYLKQKSAPAVDLDINSLCFGVEDEVGIAALNKMLQVLLSEIKLRRDFQVVQSYLNVVLFSNSENMEVIVSNSILFKKIRTLQDVQKESWTKLRGKIQTSLCLIEHMSGQIQ